MKVVVALGGNALQRRGEPADLEHQRRNLQTAARAVAELAGEHQVVVTHGNGPQVGWLALRTQQQGGSQTYPLDLLDAGSEGMIGYLLEQELANLLPDRAIASLLTQVSVDPADPAFVHPDKPIGPMLSEGEARRLAAEYGWSVAPDSDGWRRVVPSPRPERILELTAIRTLLDAGTLVICAGGGGIPVAVDAHGATRGVEAVIDKDRAAALLGLNIHAEALLLLTDVDAVYRDWGTPQATPIHHATPDALSAISFAPGSMAPKVEAACRFVREGGKRAGIGRVEDAAAVLGGWSGTTLTSES